MDDGFGGVRTPSQYLPSTRRASRRPATDEDETDTYSQRSATEYRMFRHQRPNDGGHENDRRRIPIEDVLEGLGHRIQDALSFYHELQQDFSNDVHRIRRYAPEELLSYILQAKIASMNSPEQRRRRSRRSTEPQKYAESDRGFYTVQKVLIATLRRADADLKSCKCTSEIDPALVSQQIKKTYKAIHPSLNAANVRIPDVKILATELEMLLVFLKRQGDDSQMSRSDCNGSRAQDFHDHDHEGEQEDWDDGQ